MHANETTPRKRAFSLLSIVMVISLLALAFAPIAQPAEAQVDWGDVGLVGRSVKIGISD